MAGEVKEMFVGHTVTVNVDGSPARCKSISDGNMENPRRSQDGVSVMKVYNAPEPDEVFGVELFDEPPHENVITAAADTANKPAASLPFRLSPPRSIAPDLEQ